MVYREKEKEWHSILRASGFSYIEDCRTLFTFFCGSGFEVIVRDCLFAAGRIADILQVDHVGNSALMAAVHENHFGIVRLLSDHPQFPELLELPDSSGFTPLLQAAGMGHVDLVRFLMEAGADVTKVEALGNSALLLAIRNNHEAILPILADHPQFLELIDLPDRDGVTPLMFACYAGRDGTVQLLLDGGAEISRVTQNGASALMVAAYSDHASTVQILSNHPNFQDEITRRTNDGSCAFHIACQGGDVTIVRSLLDRDIHQLEFRDLEGHTAIFYATGAGHVDVVELLLESGANIFAMNRQGDKPFDCARRLNDLAITQLILEKYVDFVVEREGHFAAHCINAATYFQDKALVQPPQQPPLLAKLECGTLSTGELATLIRSPEFASSVHNHDYNGSLPLHSACQNGAPLAVLQALVDVDDAALFVPNNDGNLPLHLAIGGNVPLDAVRWLLEQYEDALQTPNLRGDLPLHVACREQAPVEIFRLLQEQDNNAYDAALQTPNNDGDWPLSVACGNSAPLEIVQMMAQHFPPALRNANNDGFLPLHIHLSYTKDVEVVEYWKAQDRALVTRTRDGKLPLAAVATAQAAPLSVLFGVLRAHPDALLL